MKCDKLFDRHGNYYRHTRSCEAGVKHKFVGGTFRVKPTVFDDLKMYGVDIPQSIRTYPYRAVYDIESMLSKEFHQESTEKTTYVSLHRLISISVCSNVPGFEDPKCFVLKSAEGQNELVEEFLEYLRQISDEAARRVREIYEEFEVDEIDNETIQRKWDEHISQLPVLSFNGGRYDVNVLREYLFPLLAKEGAVKYVIKKGNSYMCLSTEQLRFLDLVYYIAPGNSLDKFSRAYGAKARKGYFPYEWLDEFNKLEVTEFPAYESFYSSLKDHNMIEPKVGESLSKDEEELIGRTPGSGQSPPITREESIVIGRFRYTQLKEMFDARSWSMRDYLQHYNNLDTISLIEAIKNLVRYYTDRGVDMFKHALSGIHITYTQTQTQTDPHTHIYTHTTSLYFFSTGYC